jgi:hypothetical protein
VSFRGGLQTGDDAQKGALARLSRSQDHDKFVLLHIQTDVIENMDPLLPLLDENLGDILTFDLGLTGMPFFSQSSLLPDEVMNRPN